MMSPRRVEDAGSSGAAEEADDAEGAGGVEGATARGGAAPGGTGASVSDGRGVDLDSSAASGAGSRGSIARTAGSLGADARGAEDLTAIRCARVRELYGLSSREAEVMELIVRGNTGPAIAEMLFISENTMRTHSKRIYAKMGVHKKQELVVLVEGVDVS